MVVIRNLLRWLLLGPRRFRRAKILISATLIATVFRLYFFNTGGFLHQRILSSEHSKRLAPAAQLAAKLQLSLHGRIIAVAAHNQHEDNNLLSRRGGVKDNKKQSEKNTRVHPGFQFSEDVARTQNERISLSNLVLSGNTTSRDQRHRFCKDFFLTRTNKNFYGACEPHKPTADACKLAEALYSYDPSLSQCKRNKEHSEICSLDSEVGRQKTVLNAKCDGRICKRLTNKGSKSERKLVTFGVYTIDPEDGVLKSLRNFSKISELEIQLPRIALLTARNKFNFLFVKCFGVNNQTLTSQLISLPPSMTTQETTKTRPKNTINVNIVLLDSVSRPHFYRSLPKTVETLRKLAARSHNASARVYDFELFQAIHGHTTHNEHALFTGQLLPPLDPEEDPPSVKAEVLFGQFKRAGYQTMWQEDLCWTAGWGLTADLAAEDWEELQTKLDESFVDNTGDNVMQ